MIKLKVCIGSACHIKGSYNVIQAFQHSIEEHDLGEKVDLSGTFCLGTCSDAVSVQIDECAVQSVTGITAKKFFSENVLPMVK